MNRYKSEIMTRMLKWMAAIALLLLCGQAVQAQPYPIYVSKQTGQSSTFSGSNSKQTDQYEDGNVNISTVGHITYNVNPNDLSIGHNESKTWDGSVTADIASAPAPGSSADASITGHYTVHYSRPAGTGSGGTVTSTYVCSDNGSLSGHGGCPYHGSTPGLHEIVEKTGDEIVNFTVYSIQVTLPDTICLTKMPGSNGATATVMAASFPMTGGTFQWTSLSSAITIGNPTSQTATITINDTNITTASVQVEFTIGGVSYKATAVAKACDCNCKPINGGETFGPLAVTFNANPTSTSPDGNGMCTYSSSHASFTLSMNDFINKQAGIQDATISFKKNCKTGQIGEATISWSGSVDIGDIWNIKASVTALSLTVGSNGKLSGSVTLQAKLDEDKNIGPGGIFVLRKGVNGQFSFAFNNTNTFNGSFNFQGIQNINIDIVKGDNVVIGKFQNGSLDAAGTLTGTFTAAGGAKYKTNAFTVTMNDLSLGFSAGVQTGFSLNNGSGSVTISEMSGVTGTVTLGLSFTSGNCLATLNASNITAFSMTLQDLNLAASFTSSFDMEKIEGSLKAKHNSFDVAIDVSEFKVENGALTKFSASGKVKYNAFTFELLNSSYQPTELTISAKVELAVTGNAKLQVDNFKIAGDGTITVGGISGEFHKTPVDVTFSATFQASRFKGSFTATFTNIGLDGNIDVGAMSTPDYNFAYLAITAKTSIPLGNSGLKLTQIGGQIGLNYQLPSTPTNGTYLIGLTLGVADIADMCEVTGNPVVTLGNNSFVLTLNGTIKVLKNNTFFTGTMNVNYKVPQQTIDGSVGTEIKIPASGFIFTSQNLNVGFNIGNNAWSASGSNMGGNMFNNVIAFSQGHISMNGSLSSPTAMTGSLGGKASANFNQSANVSFMGVSFTGTIIVNMNSDVDVSLNENGLNGSFGVYVTGSGTMDYDCWFINGSMTVSGNSNASIGYNSNGLNLSGDMTINLPYSLCIPFTSNCLDQITVGLNVSI